jgi:Cation efflux family
MRRSVNRAQPRNERFYVVAITFFLLALYITWEAARQPWGAAEVASGIILAVQSLAVMPTLALAKQRVGKEMGSRALVADSKETWVCSYLSLALLLGVGAYAAVGWWWADPLVALVMLPVILWQGWETLAEAREPADHQDWLSWSLFGGMKASEFHTGVAEQASDHRDQLRELGRRCRRWARWPQDRYAISVGVSDQLNRQCDLRCEVSTREQHSGSFFH